MAVRNVTDNTSGINGLLLVDKPAGITSHDVVLAVRRAYGERSIGHLGTLDPFATGLLVLLLGRSTRLATFIENEPKVYQATIAFGAETDTDDNTGRVVRTALVPARERVIEAVATLTGTIQQIPPAYSAKKIEGERAYDMARRGDEVQLEPVAVTVHHWHLHEWHDDQLDVTITCGGGTYIRALARDLGRVTGSAAHLTALRRVASGGFQVQDAAPLDVIQSDARPAVRALRVVAEPA